LQEPAYWRIYAAEEILTSQEFIEAGMGSLSPLLDHRTIELDAIPMSKISKKLWNESSVYKRQIPINTNLE